MPIHGANYLRPPPDLINGEEEYEVKNVLAKRRIGWRHQLQYLVKWKGYPDTNNQWINTQDMSADEAIAEFECSNSAPKEHIRCYNLAIVKSDLDYLGVLLSFDGTLRDVHNVENQWLKQVSDLRGSE